MDVGIRELKKHLSEYLERAHRGETIRVTDRGRPKAILAPLPAAARERGIEQGWLRPGRKSVFKPVKRYAGSARVQDVLADDRGR